MAILHDIIISLQSAFSNTSLGYTTTNGDIAVNFKFLRDFSYINKGYLFLLIEMQLKSA